MQYDYLPKSNIETGNLRTEEQLKQSMKELQCFGGIPQTGLLDNATIELMQRPRCGLPDHSTNSICFPKSNHTRRRQRRYVIQGQKWSTNDLTWR